MDFWHVISLWTTKFLLCVRVDFLKITIIVLGCPQKCGETKFVPMSLPMTHSKYRCGVFQFKVKSFATGFTMPHNLKLNFVLLAFSSCQMQSNLVLEIDLRLSILIIDFDFDTTPLLLVFLRGLFHMVLGF